MKWSRTRVSLTQSFRSSCLRTSRLHVSLRAAATLARGTPTGRQHCYSTGNTQTVHLHRQATLLQHWQHSNSTHTQAGNTATALATLKQYTYTGRQQCYSTGNTQTVHLHRQATLLQHWQHSNSTPTQAGNTATALATLKQYTYTGRQHCYSTGNTQTVHLHRQATLLQYWQHSNSTPTQAAQHTQYSDNTHNTATITLATLYCNQISTILCSLVHSQNVIQSPPKEKKSSPHTSTSY